MWFTSCVLLKLHPLIDICVIWHNCKQNQDEEMEHIHVSLLFFRTSKEILTIFSQY